MRFEARLKLIDGTMLTKKRTSSYKSPHCMQYGGLPAQRRKSGTFNVVRDIECMLCIYLGCDIKVISKQERTINTKLFNYPFCSYFYNQYHYNQQPEPWREYQGVDDAGNMVLSEVHVPVKDLLHGFFGTQKFHK